MSSQSAAHRSASQATVNAYRPAAQAPQPAPKARKVNAWSALVSVAILSGFAYFVPALADWAATSAR